MSCIISFAGQTERTWQVKNVIYRWFIDLALERGAAADVRYTLEMSVLTHGFIIGGDWKPAVEPRAIVAALLPVAREISQGTLELPHALDIVDPEAVRRHFADLAALLAGATSDV